MNYPPRLPDDQRWWLPALVLLIFMTGWIIASLAVSR